MKVATTAFSCSFGDGAIVFHRNTSTYQHLYLYDRLCVHVGIENLLDITNYLHQLDRRTVLNLGLVLGLTNFRLSAIMGYPTFLQNMLAAWLERVDRLVLQTGVPTWKRLVEALKDARVGQNELASKIEQDKLHGMYHKYPLLRWHGQAIYT